MNALEEFNTAAHEPGRLLFPGIVAPDAKKKSELGAGSLNVLLANYTVEERVQKYFEFCRAWDKREDPYLRDEFQMFSHRLHWDEHPYVDAVKGLNIVDRIWVTLVFSFTNEHWGSFTTLLQKGPEALAERFKDPAVRAQRNDLFQIYYPKGTKIREWLIEGTLNAATKAAPYFRGANRPRTMMQAAYHLRDVMTELYGFRSVLYPCKNTARYLAMGCPELVDPDTYIHPGTGSFRGFHQVFGDPYLFGKTKFELGDEGEYIAKDRGAMSLVEQFHYVMFHPDNPVERQQYINHEDKMCFFFKRLAIEVGVQKPTHRIPYSMIFPEDFSLKKPVQA